MREAKIVLSIVLIGLVVVFVVQNTEVLTINFLIWNFSIRRAFMIFIVLAIGILTGWLLRGAFNRRRAKS
ncbi:MAG: LapA family protein [Pseudomonadota bacterium]